VRKEADSQLKHEYVDGQVYAMAEAGERHNRIAGNAFFQFRSAARGSPCGVFIADMKLRVAEQNSFYYPDVMLTCQADDDHPLSLEDLYEDVDLGA
jgi:Uma2 family endonuclease